MSNEIPFKSIPACLRYCEYKQGPRNTTHQDRSEICSYSFIYHIVDLIDSFQTAIGQDIYTHHYIDELNSCGILEKK